MYVHRRKSIDVPIKEIHGELKGVSGQMLEAVFEEAHQKARKVDGEIFEIQEVVATSDGLRVTASFPAPHELSELDNPLERAKVLNT